jgi:pantothenate kinase
MDGFHLTRAELDALPNATEAHQRRGAPWTFDAAKLLSFVRALRALPVPADAAHAVEPLYAPSFDHAKKDPVERDIRIDPAARVVVLEGLYLSLGTGLWREICAEMDELWFVEADGEVARRRLVERHLLSGVARDREEAERRAGGSDALNAEEIVRDRLAVDEVVMSVEDDMWKGSTLEED